MAGKGWLGELHCHGNGLLVWVRVLYTRDALTDAVVGRRKAPAPGCTQAHTWRLLPALANTRTRIINYFTRGTRCHSQHDPAPGPWHLILPEKKSTIKSSANINNWRWVEFYPHQENVLTL